ncbi:MAG: redoxin domain-containing protein [Acidimicrobiales bacterium]
MSKAAIAAVLLGGLAALAVFGPLLGDGSSGTSSDPPEEAASDTPTSAPTTNAPNPAAPTPLALTEAPPMLGPAPDLVELDGWLQTDAASFADFAGRVRVVQFWTFTCSNCRNTLPHLQALHADAGPRGLQIIGVHAPEFDRERDPAAVAAAAIELGVTWPIALDTEKVNFRAWQGNRRFWPRTYVIDQAGEIRFDHIGEGAYDELTATVDWLLTNPPSAGS